jgi:hypothetical protein
MVTQMATTNIFTDHAFAIFFQFISIIFMLPSIYPSPLPAVGLKCILTFIVSTPGKIPYQRARWYQ